MPTRPDRRDPIDPDRYAVIGRAAEVEIEVRRSRFLGRVERADDEAVARRVVATARATHWDAGHHCSAFRLGPAGAIQRSSDDGEPAGTAGAPLLAAIEKAGVSDAVVVVSRWFGGILLGTGGLARAYGDAARAALERAGSRPRLLARRVAVTIGYDDAGRVETDVRESGVTVVGTRYEPESVVLELEIPVGAVGDVRSGLSARTGGRASYSVGEQIWVDG